MPSDTEPPSALAQVGTTMVAPHAATPHNTANTTPPIVPRTSRSPILLSPDPAARPPSTQATPGTNTKSAYHEGNVALVPSAPT